jgi:beta-mannosidase
MNMLRVTANTVYESDAFYATCDRLGMLVWQDFMFASFDYPFADEEFRATARAESAAFVRRTQTRASIAVLCGNSEVEMQALLVDKPVDAPEFFVSDLATICAEVRPDVPYVPGTPGGSVPVVSPREGWSHYYGVGVFLRPMSDARLSEVRFATECLGFAQAPARATQAEWASLPWAERITRGDSGVGDFEMTHAYYVREIYGLDPDVVRTTDPALWDALFESLSGAIMEATYAEWRITGQCRGGLIWNWRDMWAGAGLGVLDAAGRSKASMSYLRRALAPQAVFFSDEGLNGLEIHLLNEQGDAAHAELSLELYADGACVERRAIEQGVAPRGHARVMTDALLGRFSDVQRAWRLGSASCDLLVARWGTAAPAFHFPTGWPVPVPRAIGLDAARDGDQLRVVTREFAHTVVVEGTECSDNYFYLAPGEARVMQVAPGPLTVSALGAIERVRLS